MEFQQHSSSIDFPHPSPQWGFLRQVDRLRKFQGLILDLCGAGPVETPHRVVFREPGVLTLRDYGEGRAVGPVLLIVPAPIKAHYIWDLVPGASVVRQCRENGIRVFLIEWESPEPDRYRHGLADYACRFIVSCIKSITAQTAQEKVFIAGHSLGGTFGAVFASLYPGLLEGLILAGAPVSFGNNSGDITAFIRLLTRSGPTRHGNVPGSALSISSSLASPVSFIWERWLDWLESINSTRATSAHLHVFRWTLDELPLDGRLFREVADLLYRENGFMRGNLVLDGMRAAPENIKIPILSIIDPVCRVVPPESVLPIYDAAAQAGRKTLFYQREPGVALQHVGMLVGRNAHRSIWPEAIEWIYSNHGER